MAIGRSYKETKEFWAETFGESRDLWVRRMKDEKEFYLVGCFIENPNGQH